MSEAPWTLTLFVCYRGKKKAHSHVHGVLNANRSDDVVVSLRKVVLISTVDGGAEKSVHCELDKKLKVGQVKCNVCGEQW